MLLDRRTLSAFCNELRNLNKKIVFTNGCFDLVHVGHVRYLSVAKSFGDILIVGLNDDESVRRLKGNARPIINQFDRAEILLGLRSVDHVVLFNEETAENLIFEINPCVYVKGGDYVSKNFPEAQKAKSLGGRVEFVNFIRGYSTTDIVNKILKRFS